jgi:Mlc titration factor MtfA (ptsG expression regulator)
MIDIELGKALNKVEDLQLIADYKGDAITLEDAGYAVEQAETFFAVVRSRFFADKK